MTKYTIIQKALCYLLVAFFLCITSDISLAAPSIPNNLRNTDLAKRVETIQRMKTIEKALDYYAQGHDRAPCPARSDRTSNNVLFGQEEGTASDCDNGLDDNSGNLFAGSVPVRIIGLDDSYILDGWGHRILYIVDQRFTNKGDKATDLGGIESSYLSMIKGEIEILDQLSGTPLNDNTSDQTMAVLISHGANGHGAYTLAGNRIDTNSSDTDELANSHYRGGGSFDSIFIKKDPNASYDDIVRFVQRSSNVSIFCPGFGNTQLTRGSTPDVNEGYPAYDWPGASVGETAIKSCGTGYSGTVERNCISTANEAVWNIAPPDPDANCQCTEITGDSGDGFGNVIWDATDATPSPGITITQSCGSPTADSNYDGFYSGDIERTCIGDGSAWGNVTSNCTCNAQSFTGTGYTNAIFPSGEAVGSMSNQPCDPNYTGDVMATCQPSGGWQVTGNACIGICPEITGFPSFHAYANWPQTNESNTASGTCSPGLVPSGTGLPERTCQGPGIWTSITGNCQCAADLLTDIGFINQSVAQGDVGTSQDLACNDAGFSGTFTATCSANGQWDTVSNCTNSCTEISSLPITLAVNGINSSYTSSGVTLGSDNKIRITATGNWNITLVASNVNANGTTNPCCTSAPSNYELPGSPEGALVGRVGSHKFFSGTSIEIEGSTFPATGSLSFIANDSNFGAGYTDNSGSQIITIENACD